MKPLELVKTLRLASKLYLYSLQDCFILAFVIALLSQLLNWLALNTVNFTSGKLSITSPLLIVYVILTLFIVLFGNALIQIRQECKLVGVKQPFLLNCYYLFKRLSSLLIAGIIFSLLALAGTLLYIIPGIIIMAFFYLYMPAILFGKKTAFQSLNHSFNLTRHYFFTTVSLVLATLILLWIPPLLLEALGENLYEAANSFGLEQTFVTILLAFILPLTNAINLTWYHRITALTAPPKTP